MHILNILKHTLFLDFWCLVKDFCMTLNSYSALGWSCEGDMKRKLKQLNLLVLLNKLFMCLCRRASCHQHTYYNTDVTTRTTITLLDIMHQATVWQSGSHDDVLLHITIFVYPEHWEAIMTHRLILILSAWNNSYCTFLYTTTFVHTSLSVNCTLTENSAIRLWHCL